MTSVCFLIAKNSGVLGLGPGVAEAPHVCILHHPGVAARPSPAVTSAEEAGAWEGRGPELSCAREEVAGCAVWSGVEEEVGLDQQPAVQLRSSPWGRWLALDIHTDPGFEFCLFYFVCQLLEFLIGMSANCTF